MLKIVTIFVNFENNILCIQHFESWLYRCLQVAGSYYTVSCEEYPSLFCPCAPVVSTQLLVYRSRFSFGGHVTNNGYI